MMLAIQLAVAGITIGAGIGFIAGRITSGAFQLRAQLTITEAKRKALADKIARQQIGNRLRQEKASAERLERIRAIDARHAAKMGGQA